MRKSAVGLVMLSCILWTSTALTSSRIMINALESPVWMQRGGIKTAISTGDEILIEDRLLTGDSGRLALQLDSGIELQLDVNSEIEIIAFADSETAAIGALSEVKFHRGRACVQFRAQPKAVSQFSLQIADAASMIIHEQGHICIEYSDDLSSIVLIEGTVQITNSIEPSMVVLSDAGSEYRFDNTGYFELGKIEAEISIEVSNDATPALEAVTENGTSGDRIEAAGSTETGEMKEDTAEAPRSADIDTSSAYVYTVYMFSTRSQKVANEVNQKLQDAGHQTRVIASRDAESLRYRIAVSGFSSRQAAQIYSADVVGKYGISDTWIGRSKVTE